MEFLDFPGWIYLFAILCKVVSVLLESPLNKRICLTEKRAWGLTSQSRRKQWLSEVNLIVPELILNHYCLSLGGSLCLQGGHCLWHQQELSVLFGGLMQSRSLKISQAPIFWCSAFFVIQLSHPYMAVGKTIALTIWTFVDKVMSLLFNMLSRFV